MPYASHEIKKAAHLRRWHLNKKTGKQPVRFPTPEQLACRSLDWKAIGEAYRGFHE